MTTLSGEEIVDPSDPELTINVRKCSEMSGIYFRNWRQQKKLSFKSIPETNECFVNVSKSGKSRYICEIYLNFKDTLVNTFSYRGKIPAICTANGTILR